MRPDTVEELELLRAERAAEMRMRSAEHWLCLQADAWLERPTESTAAEMRKARDEWRAREAVWSAAVAALAPEGGTGRCA